jgi:hypothetical protein
MSVLSGQKRLVIVGATGMVGGYALRYALALAIASGVVSIGRRSLDIAHPKLKQVLHRDFTDCSALAETLSNQLCRMRRFARSPWTTRSSSREYFTAIARAQRFHS